MKAIFPTNFKSFLLSAIFFVSILNAGGQTSIPEDFSKSPLKDQLKYIEDRTRIYENFRAIREDMFQKIKKNITDTLTNTFNKINTLNRKTSVLNYTIDSLNSMLNTTKTSLNDITQTKDSIKIIGMEVSKGTYNTIMWTIIAILLVTLLLGFSMFQRNQNIINNRNKDLLELKEEFEAYRKTSREAREKMTLSHFNELKKLRGE